jgi:hypothetical protein
MPALRQYMVYARAMMGSYEGIAGVIPTLASAVAQAAFGQA